MHKKTDANFPNNVYGRLACFFSPVRESEREIKKEMRKEGEQ